LVTVAIRFVPPIYQTVNLALAAYVLLFMPRAMVNLRSGLAQVPVGLEEASRSLGISPTRTFLRVTLRLTAPAAAAGACLVFVGVATELTATLLLAPEPNAGDAVLVTEQRTGLRGGPPYALLLVLLAVPVTLVLYRQATGRQPCETPTPVLRISAREIFGGHRVLHGVDHLAAGSSRRSPALQAVADTLLRIVAGFETPDAGTVSIAGRRVVGTGGSVPAHRRDISYVAQDGALFPISPSARTRLRALRQCRQNTHRVTELLQTVSSASHARRRPHELSGGQQQRVALARALARRPALMLLDEPFSALDTGLRASTRKAVAELLTKAHVTTLLVTHDQEEALSIADQVAVMRDGRFTKVGTPQQVYLQPGDRFTAGVVVTACCYRASSPQDRRNARSVAFPCAAPHRTGPPR
jgi:iron(III) transport system ATP-binding protein